MSNNENFGTGITSLSDQGFTAKVVLKDGDYTYIATAMPGTPVNVPKWSVCRVLTDGSVNEGTTVWANGSNTFANKADDMTSLSYS